MIFMFRDSLLEREASASQGRKTQRERERKRDVPNIACRRAGVVLGCIQQNRGRNTHTIMTMFSVGSVQRVTIPLPQVKVPNDCH